MSVLASQRGDTIIEVLLAFAVFSLVSVGSMVVMNQGTNASQRALEITMVREQVDAQADALRAAQQAFTVATPNSHPEWNNIALQTNNSSHFNDPSRCPANSSDVSGSFIMDPRDASAVTTADFLQDINGPTAPPYAQTNLVTGSPAQAYGIWIERTYHQGTVSEQPGWYDFAVRACWYAAGLNVPLQVQTSVRLYEPAS